MSTFACAEVRELAPELAVSIVGGPERAEALQHMSVCGPCRALVGELAEAADALTLLAAEAEPPPGFEKRVLGAIGAERRRNWRRTAALAAVVAAASAIITIVGVRFAEYDDERPVVAQSPAVRTTQMISTYDDRPVGDVLVANGSPAVVMIAVDYGPMNGTYTVELQNPLGESDRLGRIDVVDGKGTWGGTTHLEPEGKLLLLDDERKPVCTGNLPPVN
jgi:hypothetical protein